MPRALIVGAGIGGLAAGAALRQAGWGVRIFERAPGPRAEGFALSMAPNAVAALQTLGVAERVAATGHAIDRGEIRDRRGVTLKRFAVSGAGQSRALFVLREALHTALLDAAGAQHVSFGAEATSVTIDGDRARVTLADGRSEAADVLIGADGANSRIRRWLHPAEPPPRDSGFVGIRGLARTAGPDDLSFVGYVGGGVEAAAIRAAPNAVYWYISTRSANGPAVDAPAEDLLPFAAGLLDARFEQVVRMTPAADVRIDRLFDRDPGAAWGRGPVTLLGDASQPVLPHTGQGAALALEDAVALALALKKQEPAEALRRYEQVRAAHKRPFVARGRRTAAVASASHPLAATLLGAVIRLVPARLIASQFLLVPAKDPHQTLR